MRASRGSVTTAFSQTAFSLGLFALLAIGGFFVGDEVGLGFAAVDLFVGVTVAFGLAVCGLDLGLSV